MTTLEEVTFRPKMESERFLLHENPEMLQKKSLFIGAFD